MNRFLLSSVAALALTSAASAADLPARAAPPPPVPVPVFTWTGFYAGVHGAWIRPDIEVRSRSPFGNRRFTLDEYGFGGGGQVGYLMQFGNIVAGLEADITATDFEDSRRFTVTVAGVRAASGRVSADMSYFGTVKGRVGFSFPSFFPFFQQSMIYATGGLGYADVEYRGRASILGLGTFNSRADDTQFGFVVGGGTENAITNNISIKTETLYYNLEDVDVRARGTGLLRGVNARSRFENDGWISKIGVNFRFSSF
jgi:outer membrane immunogenic protein